MTYLGREAVIQYAMVGTQFYDIPWSGRSFRHVLVGTQFPICPVRDAVLQHAMVLTQFYDML